MMKSPEKTVPELRFPEFQGEWAEERFGKIYSFITTNSLSRDKLNYKEGSVKNIHYGDIHKHFNSLFRITEERVPFVNPEIDLSKAKEESFLQEGDLVFADASEDYADIGKAIEIVELGGEKVLAGLHTLLARKKDPDAISRGFGAYLMKTQAFRRKIKIIAQGTKVLGISGNKMQDLSFFLPSHLEQQKITNFLVLVNNHIRLLEEKYQALLIYKKGILQQLFPAPDETNPKLRFKDSDGKDFPDWEVKCLGNIGEFLKGRGISKSDIRPNAHQPCIRYGELYTLYHEVISEAFSRTDIEGEELFLSEENDILVPTSGETAWDIARASCVLRSGIAIGSDINVLRSSEDGKFMAYLLSHGKKRELARLAQGISVIHLYNSQLKSLEVPIPREEEQKKIASFLMALDRQARQLLNQIELVYSFKKGLLQKMFV